MKGFTTPAQLMGIRSMVDGGMGLTLHTNELSPAEKATIMGFHMQSGWLLFSPNEIKESDVPPKDAEKFVKTPSQRLRATIMVLWHQEGEVGDSEEFYRSKMEKIINMVKAKLS